ncbi:MAG: NEW3 domain-containing protein [Blautia sp.]|nr:NEW3 domain-containing protein [Blautia sp.]
MEMVNAKRFNGRTIVRKAGLITMLSASVLLAGAVNVFAEETSFEMSTDYPGITAKAGDNVTFSLDFQGTAGTGCDASLSISDIPEGWEGTFKGSTNSQISRVHINTTESMVAEDVATFSLDIPEDAQDGSYTVELQAKTDNGSSDMLELEINVSEQEAGSSSFAAEYPSQQAAAGTQFSFDMTLINNRASAQSYSLSAEAPSGWQVSFTPSGESSQVASINVDAGSSQGLTASIVPPEDLKEGEYTIPCTAISAEETLTAELTITITGSYEVELSTPSGKLSFDAYANAEKSVTLSVTNNGNVDLQNLNLTSSAPSGWEVSFDESTIDLLEAGSTKEVTAHVTPGEDAMTGDYVATLTVSTEETSDSTEFRVSVKTRTTWGIIALGIIVLLVIFLARIFKKYGRR